MATYNYYEQRQKAAAAVVKWRREGFTDEYIAGKLFLEFGLSEKFLDKVTKACSRIRQERQHIKDENQTQADKDAEAFFKELDTVKDDKAVKPNESD